MTGAEPGGHRVVIVGGTGNIGTSVLDSLAGDPEVTEIVALSRRRPLLSGPKTRWERTDITTDDLVRHFTGASAVVHLAWVFQPTRDPVTTWRVNVMGTLRVLEAVTEAGVPALIYGSSVAAYSPGPGTQPVDEDWPTHGWPGAAYGREKAYIERCLDSFERNHPQVRVVRMRTAFSFKAESASQQRRLFMGPFVPNRLVKTEMLPALPAVPGMHFQAVHSSDLGAAYRLAVRSSASGAFNVAAEPVLDAEALGELFDARAVGMPAWALKSLVAAAWTLRLIPASPQLFQAFLQLPVMDTTRARNLLGWTPRYSSTEAISAFLDGLQRAEGAPTPPLQSELPGGRLGEAATGVGARQ